MIKYAGKTLTGDFAGVIYLLAGAFGIWWLVYNFGGAVFMFFANIAVWIVLTFHWWLIPIAFFSVVAFRAIIDE